MGWRPCSGEDLSVSSSLLTNKCKVGQHWQIWNNFPRNLRSWDFVQYSLVAQLRAIHRHSLILIVGTDIVIASESKSMPSQVIQVEGSDPLRCFLATQAPSTMTESGACRVWHHLETGRMRHRRCMLCMGCSRALRVWWQRKWCVACTWHPIWCQRALPCQNKMPRSTQCQVRASPWGTHAAGDIPAEGQRTTNGSPALVILLGPVSPGRWAGGVCMAHPNMYLEVCRN